MFGFNAFDVMQGGSGLPHNLRTPYTHSFVSKRVLKIDNLKSYIEMNNDNKTDNLPGLWLFLSNAIPPIGFLLYFKHRNRYPNMAKKALRSAIIGVPIALIAGYILNNYILK